MTSSITTLSNGVKMPKMGFGTWQLKDKTCYNSVMWALQEGFQLIDTAAAYDNEEYVGQAIKDFIASNQPTGSLQFDSSTKNNIFVTTKVPPKFMGYDGVIESVTNSLKKLKMDCVDCVLLHWPGSYHPWDSPANRKVRHESWKAMEALYKDNKTKSIGVSNYYVNHLDQLMEDGVEVIPHVNQVEMHPYLQLPSLEKWANSNGMALQAYSSLGTGTSDLLTNQVVAKVAKELSCTTGQVLLKWGYQKGYLILPRTSKQERVKENWDCLKFSLNENQMEELNALDAQKHYCWDPNKVV